MCREQNRSCTVQPEDGLTHEIPILAELAPRARLATTTGTQTEMSITCRRVVTLFGSRRGCKLVLPGRKVAPVHAALVNTGTKILAVDLITKHGTKFNGLKLAYETVSDGDMISIGPWEFLISLSQPTPTDGADAHPFELDQTPRAVALEHVDSGRIFGLTREVSIVGRRRGCDLSLEDPRVSRRHAMLLMYFGYPAICDLISENKTLVNGRPVAFKRLDHGDILTFGESQFRVHLVGSSMGGSSDVALDPQADQDTQVIDSAGSDLIDIEATEGSQSWRIVDSLKRANGEG